MRNMSTLKIATHCRAVLGVVLLFFGSHSAFATQVTPSPVPNFTMDNGIGLPFYYNDSTKNLFVGFTFTYPVAFTATNVILHTCDSLGMRISFSQGNNINDRVANPILAYGTATSTPLPCPNGNDVTSDAYAVTYDFGGPVTFQANVQIYAQFIATTTDGNVSAPYPYGSQGLVGAGLNYPVSELQFCYSFFCGAPSWGYAPSTPTTYATAFRFTAASTVLPPVVALSTSTLEFGVVQVGELKLITITVSNTGGSQLIGTISSTSQFTISTSSQLNVAPGGTQIVAVSFAPLVGGTNTGSLTLSTNAGQIIIPAQGVGATAPVNPKPPSITSISPNPVAPGVEVKITGNNFGGKAGSILIGTTKIIPTWNDTFMTFTMPPIGANKYTVTVTNQGGSDTTGLLVLPPSPFIAEVLPISGAAGSTTWINGFNFGTQTGTVTVGGAVVQNILSWTDQKIRIQIPAVKTGQKEVVAVTSSAGATPPGIFRVRDSIVLAQYDSCTLPPLSPFECTPPVVLSTTSSTIIPGGIDIKLENVADRWYLVTYSPVNMAVPASNFIPLSQFPPNSFLLGPTSSRTLVGVSINSLPASIAFAADGATNIPTAALAADLMVRILTGSHLPTSQAELFTSGVGAIAPMLAAVNAMGDSIRNRDFIGLLSALSDMSKLAADPANLKFLTTTLKLNINEAKLLTNLKVLSDYSIYFNIYSVWLESIARLSAPTSAVSTLVTR